MSANERLIWWKGRAFWLQLVFPPFNLSIERRLRARQIQSDADLQRVRRVGAENARASERIVRLKAGIALAEPQIAALQRQADENPEFLTDQADLQELRGLTAKAESARIEVFAMESELAAADANRRALTNDIAQMQKEIRLARTMLRVGQLGAVVRYCLYLYVLVTVLNAALDAKVPERLVSWGQNRDHLAYFVLPASFAIIGALLFALRVKWRRLYAVTEIGFAWVSCASAVSRTDVKGPWLSLVPLLAGLYLFVRGYDNWREGTKQIAERRKKALDAEEGSDNGPRTGDASAISERVDVRAGGDSPAG